MPLTYKRTTSGYAIASYNFLFPPILTPVAINSITTSASPYAYPFTAADVYGTSITNGINYNVYSFCSIASATTYTINYSCPSTTTIYVLAVGGGGGGGSFNGAGGGAGGVVMSPVVLPAGSSQTITVSVGTGGAATSGRHLGYNGTSSTVSFSANTNANIIASGGGGGGGSNDAVTFLNGQNGGSGGGGEGGGNRSKPGIAVNNYTNFANDGAAAGSPGGGGGGAGTVAYSANGGDGIQCFLPGISNFSPSNIPYLTYYWGGGGGGSITGGGSAGYGGLGGGGGGGGESSVTSNGNGGVLCINTTGITSTTQNVGGNGGANSGGGGGGSWTGNGGAGGSGIVVIAFPRSAAVTTNQKAVLPASLVLSSIYNATLNVETLSPTAYNSIKGAFACRLINYNYFGPVLTLRHSLDTVGQYTKNFYADISGNLGTQYLGTGQSVSSWLSVNGANTTYAFVTKWYNQGMDVSFNSAIQYTIAAQPIYDLANGVVNFGYTGGTGVNAIYPGYMQLPTNFFPPDDTSYSIVTRYYNFGTTYGDTQQDLLMVANSANNSYVGRLGFNLNGNPANYLYGVTGFSGTTLATQNGVITYKYNSFTTAGNTGSNYQIFQNGTQSAATGKTSDVASYSQGSTYIGNTSFDQYANTGAFSGTNYFLQAQLYNLYVFNTAISDTDRVLIEATPYQYSVPSSMTITISSLTSTSFVASWTAVANATTYILFINGSVYDIVTSGQTITPSHPGSWSTTIYAYNNTSVLLARGYFYVYTPSIPSVITGGAPALYYPFSSNTSNYASGTGVADTTGNGTTPPSIAAAVYYKANIGNSLYCTNTSCNLTLPNITLNTATGFTLCFWVYLTTNTAGMLWSFNWSGNRMFIYYTGTTLRFWVSSSANNDLFTVSTNRWYFITLVQPASNGVPYAILNNSTKTNLSSYASANQTSTWHGVFGDGILANNYGGVFGYISNFYIFQRALTFDEISAIYYQ